MFLKYKYAPKTIQEMRYHHELMDKLCDMIKDDSFPHLILYGQTGSGKRTISKLLLEHIYNKNVNKLVDTEYTITGCNNKPTAIKIKQSDYHIVIEPNNNNFDRYMIQEVVKTYATYAPLIAIKDNRKFKVVVINNVDKLSYYAQMSLRRTMEKYSRTCRFIMLCNSMTQLIDPLKSRCLCIRIPAPTDPEILLNINYICSHENYELKLNGVKKILFNSNNNMNNALWILECIMLNIPTYTSYNNLIIDIVSLILEKVLSNDSYVQKMLYDILITNIEGTQIINDISMALCEHEDISDEKKYQIIKCASDVDFKISNGRREIIHLKDFITRVTLVLMK